MKKPNILVLLILAIGLGIAIGSFMPREVIAVLATFNSIFGSFLGFAIPLIIIGFIVPGIAELGRGAGKILALTAGIAYVSTIAAGSLAYGVDMLVFPNILEVGSVSLGNAANPEHALVKPLIELAIPPMMDVMTALVLSFTMGLGIAFIRKDTLKVCFNEFQEIVSKLISGVIIPLLPIHVMGIFANMTFAGEVAKIMNVFAKVFVVIVLLHLTMLLIQYTIAGIISKQNPFRLLKTMLPAYVTSLGTQSSAATIPVTLMQAKANNVRESVADFVIPLCATIHLSGSTITLTSCAIAIMMLSGMPVTFSSIFPFILMLGVTMVAAPGVPGGAVMAALGILQSMLGFNEVLVSLMIALYLAQDSFGTACNVTGDCAIAVIVDKLTMKKSK